MAVKPELGIGLDGKPTGNYVSLMLVPMGRS